MAAGSRWYGRIRVGAFVRSRTVQNIIIAVILLNAAILGLETSSQIMASAGGVLHLLDKACLVIFVAELLLKLYAERWRFFFSAWNVFDFLVVGVALVPGADAFAVLRALRVLRVLRLISVIPALRRVVDALVRALPGIGSIAALLTIIFYVGAVMSTMLFGARFPQYFGDLGTSLFSLFQVMTLDNWSSMTREVTAVLPFALAFFIPFVLISALTVLNLFIAVVVDAMQGLDKAPAASESAVGEGDESRSVPDEASLRGEIAALRTEVATLTSLMRRQD